MSIKNIVLFSLVIAVLIAAVVAILFVVEIISKTTAVDVLTKAGWLLLIVAVTMAIISMIKRN